MHRGKILLVERDRSLHFYPGYWNGISGFLDDRTSLKEKVIEELGEELKIKKNEIISIRPGEVFDQDEPKYRKTWIVHPVLVRVRTDRVSLDWEAREYVWVKMSEAAKFKLLPGFRIVLQKIKRLTRE